jgi:serine/threonine protein kinase
MEMTMSSPSHDHDPRLGTLVEGFLLESCVAAGTLARVYRARAPGGTAAVKIYRADLRCDERADREHAALRAIDHPAVARLGAVGRLADGAVFLASEWIDGRPLESALAAGEIDWRAMRAILASVAGGLEAIHAAGVVHRDLKPSNIMLPHLGEPAPAVIVDFGHALPADGLRVTADGMTVGTPLYMSPEQAAGQAIDGRSDLYALGVILYRALTGATPFEGRSPAEVLERLASAAVVPPRRRAPHRAISADTEDLCMWLLARERAARLPSAHVLAVTLQALGGGN